MLILTRSLPLPVLTRSKCDFKLLTELPGTSDDILALQYPLVLLGADEQTGRNAVSHLVCQRRLDCALTNKHVPEIRTMMATAQKEYV
jgi:hypothetical protein